jgi:LysM repeat protein
MKSRTSIFRRIKTRYVVLFLVVVLLMLIFVPGASAEETSSGGHYHTVHWGETLSGIARYYGTSVHAIASANHIVNPHRIYAGSVLYIPYGYGPPPGHHPPPHHPPHYGCRTYHYVTWGDTLNKIAAWYGVSPWKIAQANGIYNLDLIYRGTKLCIP